MAVAVIDDAVDLDWDRSAASAAAEADRCAREVEEERAGDHVAGIKSDLVECRELMERMLERTRGMAEDMRIIRACVMGDD